MIHDFPYHSQLPALPQATSDKPQATCMPQATNVKRNCLTFALRGYNI